MRRALKTGAFLIALGSACSRTGLHAQAMNGQSVNNLVGVLVSGDPLPTPQISKRSVFLSVPHIRQEKNLCVPTSTAMVLEFFGDQRKPRELKALSRGRTYDPSEPFSDFTITLFRDMLSGLRQAGYYWFESTYTNNSRGFRSGMDDLKESLRNGNPVLVDTSLFTGHTFVLAGFDDEKGVLYVVDPNIAAPGLRAVPYEEFEKIWNSVGFSFDGRAAILTKRK